MVKCYSANINVTIKMAALPVHLWDFGRNTLSTAADAAADSDSCRGLTYTIACL